MLFDRCISVDQGCQDCQDYRLLGSVSPIMQAVYKKMCKVAPANMSVLIESESGNSCELAAKVIHEKSMRCNEPFYSINCIGLAESVLESELFGYAKKTDADSKIDRKGLFQLANNGTLFLDEIGDMPPNLQGSLLRALEDGIICPVGSSSPVHVDVRIICSTSCNLITLVEQKKFRQDLYLYFKRLTVTLPPLRKHPKDIPELFSYFLQEACWEAKKVIKLITEPAMRALINYAWPGNIRELRNVVRTMVVMSEDDTLDLGDLPEEISPAPKSSSPELATAEMTNLSGTIGRSLGDVEREHIRQTLELTHNNRSEAAKILCIGERTLYRKIKEYDL